MVEKTLQKSNKNLANTHEVKQYSCKFCPKKFRLLKLVKAHEKIHSGEKPFSCVICGMKFLALQTKQNHERIHSGEKPHSCKYCENKFTQLGSKNRHEVICTLNPFKDSKVSFIS